jgi:hypothetical protein
MKLYGVALRDGFTLSCASTGYACVRLSYEVVMLKPIRSLQIAVAVAIAGAATLAAQQSPSLHGGDRVRVTLNTMPEQTIVGTVVRLLSDTLVLRAGMPTGTERTLLVGRCPIGLGEITTLELSLGTSGHAGRGALYGLLAGVTVGAVAGGSLGNDPTESVADQALDGGVAIGVIGAGVGALVGATFRSEHWQTLPLDSLRMTPKRVGPEVAAASP